MQITTTDKAPAATRDRARHLASALGWAYRRRRDADWSEPVFVVGREALAVAVRGRAYRWHPALLHARMEAGLRHPMMRAGDVRPGDQILDTTCGLGTDAAFLAEMSARPVVSLEATPALALLTGVGVRLAGRPVHVVCARSGDFLAGLGDNTFDAVYSDPLFRPGRPENPSLQLYRDMGDPWRPDAGWLAQARRVSRRVVVIKDERDGDLLECLRPDEVFHSRRGSARYGRFVSEGA